MSTSISLLKRIFSVRNLMRSLFVLIALLTVWAIVCVEERWRGERLWQAYREKAMANGAILDLEQVIPPSIPSAENFAALPMIEEVFLAQREGRPISPWFAAAKFNGKIPGLKRNRKGEPMLDQWRDYFVKSGVVPATNESATAVLSALSLIEPELQQLRKAGERPKSRFPVEWELGVSTPLPHLGPLQLANKVFRLGLSAQLANNNPAAASGNLVAALNLYKALRGELGLINGLVRISNLRAIEEGIAEENALSGWSDAELREMTSSLSSIDLADDWQFALQSERAWMNSVFQGLFAKSDSELGALWRALDVEGGQMPVTLYPRGWFRLSQIKTNEHLDRMLEIVKPLSRNEPLPANPGEDPLFRRGKLAQLPYRLYALAAPAVGGISDKYADAINYHRQVQIACALRRYWLKNGSYPDQLDAIVPDYLASLPLDPIAGAPMRYRKSETGGFQLWSVGLNRIDDGGKPPEPEKSWRLQADWVLQVPGKP